MSTASLVSKVRKPEQHLASKVDESHPPVPRFITRQPLLDADLRILGYELHVNQASPLPVLPGATSLSQIHAEAVLTSVIDPVYQAALSRKLTLLNLDPSAFDSPLLAELPRENSIIAVHPACPTPDFLARCQALARVGYALALDEAALLPGMLPLAQQSRYLRFDVGNNDLMALCDSLTRLQGVRGPRLIARNVASEETFAACKKLSFDLFQGYFFTQAKSVGTRAIDGSRLRIIKLLNLVGSHADYAAIEMQFKADPGLSFKMLRFINSPAVGLRYPIRSISHALMMLGHDQLYRWLTLLLFTHQDGDGRSLALLRNALIRARFVELLGQNQLAREDRDGLFIVGILSMLDSLLNQPMRQLLETLKLSDPIVDALLNGCGIYAPCLQLAIACENADRRGMGELADGLGLSVDEVNQAHVNALIWSEGMDL